MTANLMTNFRHAVLLIGVPLAFSAILWFHPMVGDYDGLRDVTTRFQVVHVAMVLVLPLVAIGMYTLLSGLRGRAARVGSLPVGKLSSRWPKIGPQRPLATMPRVNTSGESAA